MLRSIVCGLCCLGLLGVAPAARGFQNLDFEDTLFDPGLPGEFDPSTPETARGSGDPAVVTPGWSFRAEFLDGSPVGQTGPDPDGFFLPYPVHGNLITGHIGTTSQVVLTGFEGPAFGGSVLQGEHSLFLGQALGDAFLGSSESPIPVAVQTGRVPQSAQSLLVLVEENFAPQNPDNQFTVRLNGFEVEMHAVDVADYPDVDGLLRAGTYFAGNIAPVAGLIRELAIRPEPYLSETFGSPDLIVETASIVFDDVAFSSAPSPFTPVQIPEPSAGLLLIAALLSGSGRRRY